MTTKAKRKTGRLDALRMAAEKSAREEAEFQLQEAIKSIRAGADDHACQLILEALMCLGSVRGVGNLAVDIAEDSP